MFRLVFQLLVNVWRWIASLFCRLKPAKKKRNAANQLEKKQFSANKTDSNKPDEFKALVKYEQQAKSVTVERINEPEAEHAVDEVKIVGFAAVVGEWTKKILAEKIALLGIVPDANMQDTDMLGKPKGYWSAFLWMTQQHNTTKPRWQEIVERARRGGGNDRGI